MREKGGRLREVAMRTLQALGRDKKCSVVAMETNAGMQNGHLCIYTHNTGKHFSLKVFILNISAKTFNVLILQGKL